MAWAVFSNWAIPIALATAAYFWFRVAITSRGKAVEEAAILNAKAAAAASFATVLILLNYLLQSVRS
jgi:hypothetical protein